MIKKKYLVFMLYLAVAVAVTIAAALISRGVVEDPEVKEIICDGATLVSLVITAYGFLKTFSKKN